MRVYCVCRAKGKEVTWRIKMFGASLICREFKSWSAKPKLLSELPQDVLNQNRKIGGKKRGNSLIAFVDRLIGPGYVCVCVCV